MTHHEHLREQYLAEQDEKGINRRELSFNLSLGYVHWLEQKIKQLSIDQEETNDAN